MNPLLRITRQIECRLVIQGTRITVEFPAEWQMPPVILRNHPEIQNSEMKPLFLNLSEKQTEKQTEKQDSDKEWLNIIG